MGRVYGAQCMFWKGLFKDYSGEQMNKCFFNNVIIVLGSNEGSLTTGPTNLVSEGSEVHEHKHGDGGRKGALPGHTATF